jgi:gluconolactonase
MIGPMRVLDAAVFSRMPDRLHWKGEPNAWVRMTRPGQRLHSFLEGPCFDARGDLWLVDVPYGRIFRIDPAGTWHLAHQYDGEPHSLRLRDDGVFVVADHKHGLLSFDPATGSMGSICARADEDPFLGLSDLTLAPNGDVWFTDPGRTSLSDPTGRVFRLRRASRTPELVLANVPYPNGIALSPDGKFVYLAATRANAVWRFFADTPAAGAPMVGAFLRLSGGLGPDGLAVDPAGRLAVAQAQAGRAYVFTELGDPVAAIHTPGGLWTTSCVFGAGGREIFIVEAQTASVFRAKLEGE